MTDIFEIIKKIESKPQHNLTVTNNETKNNVLFYLTKIIYKNNLEEWVNITSNKVEFMLGSYVIIEYRIRLMYDWIKEFHDMNIINKENIIQDIISFLYASDINHCFTDPQIVNWINKMPKMYLDTYVIMKIMNYLKDINYCKKYEDPPCTSLHEDFYLNKYSAKDLSEGFSELKKILIRI